MINKLEDVLTPHDCWHYQDRALGSDAAERPLVGLLPSLKHRKEIQNVAEGRWGNSVGVA